MLSPFNAVDPGSDSGRLAAAKPSSCQPGPVSRRVADSLSVVRCQLLPHSCYIVDLVTGEVCFISKRHQVMGQLLHRIVPGDVVRTNRGLHKSTKHATSVRTADTNAISTNDYTDRLGSRHTL